MNDESLIDYVQKYDVLYDTSHAKFHDEEYKREVWNKIAMKLRTSGK